MIGFSMKPPIGTTKSLDTSTPGLQRLYNSTSSRVTELAAWSPEPGREEATEAASDSAGRIWDNPCLTGLGYGTFYVLFAVFWGHVLYMFL